MNEKIMSIFTYHTIIEQNYRNSQGEKALDIRSRDCPDVGNCIVRLSKKPNGIYK